MISSLTLKMLRDLWGMKGQAFAIAMVLAGGVATFVMSRSVFESLTLTQTTFYRDYQFADAFVSLKRAPESMRTRLAEIPGVQTVETRVMAQASVQVLGYEQPVTAIIVSQPDHGQPILNQLHVKAGELASPAAGNEIVISEAFASAHGLKPGDSLLATINGRQRRLRIVGVAITPEFIYQLQPGAIIPDFKAFGVFWMARTPLAAAYDMEGAFNNAVFRLDAAAKEPDVVKAIDLLLARYGSVGAHGRYYQTSHRYLTEEFKGLNQMAIMFPVIFLSVAAFLLNVVVSRLIATQREQVAILKAFGYTTGAIVWHYVSLILMITALGAAMGIAAGASLGSAMSSVYMDYYRFPYMLFHVSPSIALTASAICSVAAVSGVFYSVYAAARLPPAEAMQPAPPARYHVSFAERMGLGRLLSQPSRMIIRNLERRPVKSMLSVIGVAFACAVLVTGQFFGDSADYLVDLQFRVSQRDDMTITFIEPASRAAMHSVLAMRGVNYVEPFRNVPADFRFEHRHFRTSIQGLTPNGNMHRLLTRSIKQVDTPPDGILLTDHLAGMLGIGVGDLLTVEVLEGSRPVRQVPVVGVVNEWIGVYGYMQLPALNRMMREGSAITGVYLTADSDAQSQIFRDLKEIPRVAGSTLRLQALRNFYDTMAQQMLFFAFFNTILAGSIAFGVIYNSARIALSERSRELASLRVLGYTRGEISFILLGELAVLTLAGIPLGFVIGRSLGALMLMGFQTELYRFPLIIQHSTYAFAATVVLVSALLSGWIVRRKLDHLDLVAVLKTKE
ncbi:MAG: FtsX-like permease family protein [Bryobacterales bacterium]|nr:FtsX-like permease family protein [Bryobacterales bacterium]